MPATAGNQQRETKEHALTLEMNIEDPQELKSYLVNRQGISDTEIKIKSLAGGVSNRTVQINFGEASWVLKQALEKLRVAGDWYSAPERIFHEAAALLWFEHNLPGTCPKLIFEDKSQYLLAMEAVPQPFENLKSAFLAGLPKTWHFEHAGALLGKLHYQGQHKSNIPQLLFDHTFFESLRIKPYYLEASKQVKSSEHFFKQLIDETAADRYTLTHGDFSPKNLLVKDDYLILLDHEVVHYGDGTFDLGFFMTHLLAKSIYNPDRRESFLSGTLRFFETYCKTIELNNKREQRAVKHTIGCLLARVCGLSPLEYLDKQQQELQKSAALKLMNDTPSTLKDLISTFKSHLNA